MSAPAGTRVLLTRGAEDNAEWEERLRERGYLVRALACIASEPLPAARTELERELAAADWLVLTSRRGARAVSELGLPLPDALRIAAVGPATAEAARELLGHCEHESTCSSGAGGTAAALGAELAALADEPARAVLALAESARDELAEALTAAGWEVARVAVYRTLPAPPLDSPHYLEVDFVILTSPSAAAGLANLARLPATARAVTIGPTTSRAARAAGLEVAAEAESRDLEGLLAALESQASPIDPGP